MPTTKTKSKSKSSTMKKTTSKNTPTAKKKTTPAKKTSTAKSTSTPKKKTGPAKTATPAKKKTPAAKSSAKGILSKAKDALLDAGRALVPAAKTGIAVGAAAAGAFIEEAAGKPKQGKTRTKTSS